MQKEITQELKHAHGNEIVCLLLRHFSENRRKKTFYGQLVNLYVNHKERKKQQQLLN